MLLKNLTYVTIFNSSDIFYANDYVIYCHLLFFGKFDSGCCM